MKKIIYSLLILILGLVISGAGCNHDAVGIDPDPDFFGTWKWDVGANWYTVTLTSSKLIYGNHVPFSYTMEDLTWIPITNPSGAFKTTHPTGYKITGKLTANTFPEGPLKIDESDFASLGDIAVVWFYISTDKNSLCKGNEEDPSHEGSWIGFFRQ